jgi:SET domain-containing protein
LGVVDTSISTFINHGCRGSYNVGVKYDYHEMNVMDCDPEKPCITCDDQELKIYDPYADRQYPMRDCPNFVANRDIEPGEEILYDYMCMSGTDNMLEEIEDLQYLCSGGIGFVSQYEREVLVATTD